MLKHFVVILSLLCLISPSLARGDVYQFVIKKQEEKEKTRWSLSNWLETRDKMRLMDLWLAIHSPSPYEFFLGGKYQFGERNSVSGNDSGEAFIAAYASIFGLEFHQHFRLSQWEALFNFRIFGYHAQGTNITLHAGLRSRTDPATYLNSFAGLSTSMYITKHFGFEGMFRYFFDSGTNSGGIDEFGRLLTLGAFIDFQYVRTFGEYFRDVSIRRSGPGPGDVVYSGWAVGVKLFF